MANEYKVSGVVAEALISNTSAARASGVVLEGLVVPAAPNARVSGVELEALVTATSAARVSDVVVEALVSLSTIPFQPFAYVMLSGLVG